MAYDDDAVVVGALFSGMYISLWRRHLQANGSKLNPGSVLDLNGSNRSKTLLMMLLKSLHVH